MGDKKHIESNHFDKTFCYASGFDWKCKLSVFLQNFYVTDENILHLRTNDYAKKAPSFSFSLQNRQRIRMMNFLCNSSHYQLMWAKYWTRINLRDAVVILSTSCLTDMGNFWDLQDCILNGVYSQSFRSFPELNSAAVVCFQSLYYSTF